MSHLKPNQPEPQSYDPFDPVMGYQLGPDPTTLTPEEQEDRKLIIGLKKMLLGHELDASIIPATVEAILDYDISEGKLGVDPEEVELNKTFYKTMLHRIVSQELGYLPEDSIDELVGFNLDLFHQRNLKTFMEELRMREATERDAETLTELRKQFPGALHAHGIDPKGYWRVEAMRPCLERVAKLRGMKL